MAMSTGSSSKFGRQKEMRTITRAGTLLGRDTSNQYARSQYLVTESENPVGSIKRQRTMDEVYSFSEEDLHSLKVMHEVNHQNILKCHAYRMITRESTTFYEAKMEIFVGSLSDYLQKNVKKLAMGDYIPSERLTRLVRTIVEVISYLHSKNLYHGNLSWESILYTEKADSKAEGDCIVKLANFSKKEGMALKEVQCEDWKSLAGMLQEIVNIRCPHCFRHHVTRAVSFFENVHKLSDDKRKNILAEIKNLDFFWSSHDRKNYAAHFYTWCKKHKKVLEKASIVTFPWNSFIKSEKGSDLLNAINNFNDRDGRNPQGKYNVNGNIDFLKFVSAVYVHCNSLQAPGTKLGLEVIDKFICNEFPDLFWTMRELQKENNFRSH